MFCSSLPSVVCRMAHVWLKVICVCLPIVVLCFYFVNRRLVYPMLPLSLDCPLLTSPSVFSNIYLR
jgi:hypothetical protein